MLTDHEREYLAQAVGGPTLLEPRLEEIALAVKEASCRLGNVAFTPTMAAIVAGIYSVDRGMRNIATVTDAEAIEPMDDEQTKEPGSLAEQNKVAAGQRVEVRTKRGTLQGEVTNFLNVNGRKACRVRLDGAIKNYRNFDAAMVFALPTT